MTSEKKEKEEDATSKKENNESNPSLDGKIIKIQNIATKETIYRIQVKTSGLFASSFASNLRKVLHNIISLYSCYMWISRLYNISRTTFQDFSQLHSVKKWYDSAFG